MEKVNKKVEGISYLKAFKESPGMAWAAFTQLYSQLSLMQGIANTLMLLGVFYSTNLKEIFPNIPWWVYIVILFTVTLVLSMFMIFIGIPGIYRYGRKFLRTTDVEKKLDAIIKHFNIQVEE